MAAFNIAAAIPAVRKDAVPRAALPFPRSSRLAYIFIAAFFVVSMLQIFTITGKNPFSIPSYSLDFGEVYADFGENLKLRTTGPLEVLITLIKAVMFPFVIMIFFSRFKTDRLAIFFILLPLVISSLLRGTDKELVDLLILVAVAAFYYGMINWRVILYGSVVPALLMLFLLRRIGRFAGSVPNCLPQSEVCFNYSSPVAKIFGPDMEVLYVFLTNYVSQGYQGLTYALTLPFDFNFFVGHLPPVKRSLCLISNIICDAPEYQDKLTAIGWDTTTKWPSAYTFIANDLSFWFTPLYLFALGVIYRKATLFWKNERDIASLAALLLISQFMLFSSANMQVGINLDWSFATIIFLYFGLFRRTRISH
ncbi:MAG: hypothetical protein V7676_05530 [Parasphingorhabdus sp.]|uniref:hypothetical protein n=1 Tax=Parasphingorhabdus sp. TaxID=2709688 RepID=UPI003002D9D8